eukprot:gnl/Hemi2/6698_TR2284_c0_g1_i2.p4 gnl/Hemi2/6698_TR2284_c0_g1~~gnl/Hemi2/6698_TR2284_c0_g1_i2.p4  ORF type:complete len:116 (-),score=26.96 gnl/Hemi2/6698_TR2284_c0_g1_i2:168-515(-)
MAVADLDAASALMEEFIAAVKRGDYAQLGWPKTTYGVSKLGLNCITRVFARQMAAEARGILVNCCCPGYVATDMSSHMGPLTTEQGSETPTMLALLPADADISGRFWKEGQVRDW